MHTSVASPRDRLSYVKSGRDLRMPLPANAFLYYHEAFSCLLAPPLGRNTTSFSSGKQTKRLDVEHVQHAKHLDSTSTFLMARPQQQPQARGYVTRPLWVLQRDIRYHPAYDKIRPSISLLPCKFQNCSQIVPHPLNLNANLKRESLHIAFALHSLGFNDWAPKTNAN